MCLTQSQNTETRPASLSADPIAPGAQVANGLPIFKSLVWLDLSWINIHRESGNRLQLCHCRGGRLTTRSARQSWPTERQRLLESHSKGWLCCKIWGRYHGGRRPSSDDSFHSPTVISPSAPDKPSITKHYHRRRTTRWSVTAHLPTMVTLHNTRFVECRSWDDGWTVKLSSLDGRRHEAVMADRRTRL